MIPPSTTITEQGRRTRMALIWFGVGVLALNVLVAIGSMFGNRGSVAGPDGSSYVTTGAGTAALAGSMERLGLDFLQARAPIDELSLSPGETLVMIDVGDATYTPDEMVALDRFIRDGGRIVVVGQATFVELLLEEPPSWRSSGAPEGRPEGDLLHPAVIEVTLSNFGSLGLTDRDEPFLRGEDGVVIGASRPVGDGLFVWLADSYPVHNAGIGRSDAAVAVISMLGDTSATVFDEFRHGYTDSGGLLTIVPPAWRLAGLLGSIVALSALVAYGRRLGPPYDMRRRMSPGREAYLDGVAGVLARSGDERSSLSAIQREAARRADADPTGYRRSRLTAEEADALTGTAEDPDTLVTAARALARMNQERQ